MSYYPPQGSHYSHHGPPVVYASSHGHHGSSAGYYGGEPGYGGGNVVYVPSHGSSGRRHHHRHHHSAVPEVIMQPSAHYGHGEVYYRPTLGERIKRFFGFGPRHYRHKSSNSSWGFLGRSRRRKYVDPRTGGEVDRRGRPVYRV